MRDDDIPPDWTQQEKKLAELTTREIHKQIYYEIYEELKFLLQEINDIQ